MTEAFETTRVLITVMTYPHPSQHHRELVCTAGVTEAGEWVRLYPIDYRYRPSEQQFRKYQWIEVGLAARGSGNDERAESRKPKLDSIRLVGEPLPSDHGWRERRRIIDRLPVRTVNELRQAYDQDKTSLGVVRPKRIIDVKVEESDRDWKPEWQAMFNQFQMFGEQQKPLTKLPYKFSYVFECDDNETPHNAMIEDWELGVLFLKEVDRLGSEQAAADSVRHKFLNQVCAEDRDTRFFMGTVFPYNTWVVVGVFWPPHEPQLSFEF
jgi:hypothetical protein